MPCKINHDLLLSLIEKPTQTHLLFELIQYTCKSSYLSLLQVMVEPLRQNSQIMTLYNKRETPLDSLDLSYLKDFSEDTLGYQYANFLIRKNLEIAFYPTLKIRNLLSFIKHQFTTGHDILHVVCGYNTSLTDEAALQAFMLAQVQSPLALVTLGSIMIHIATKIPQDIKATMDLIVFAYKQGQVATNLLGVNWHLLFSQPLEEVRKQLNILLPS